MKLNYPAIFFFGAVSLFANCQKENSDTIGTGSNNVDEWKWEFLGKPMGDSELNTIAIHPKDENLWFVTSWKGLYVTRNGGRNWNNFLSGITHALEIVPNDPSKIFVSSGIDLYLSPDNGLTWTFMKTFPEHIVSILVSKMDNAVYVGLAWEDNQMANGIYKSNDMGKTWKYYSYNVPAKGLIPWDIEEDPVNNKLYITTEIYDHPQPYHPPFLRSSDNGLTWEDISGQLPWHSVRIQVHPQSQIVYTLTEGAGLYHSVDFGDHWEYSPCPFWLEFLLDKNNPQRFFGGGHVFGQSSGGLYYSNNGGSTFIQVAESTGHIVGSLSLNANSTTLYAACYNSGIFRTKLN